jgi:hypothetical protein
MELLARPTNRIASRFAYGAAVYWGLNVILLAAEARWHVLLRLTLWDVAEIKTLAPLLARLLHP